MLPAVELHFDYISKDKRRRRYILLDDDPHHVLQVIKPTHPQDTHKHTHTLECDNVTDLLNFFHLVILAGGPLIFLSCFRWDVTLPTTFASLLVEQPRLFARYNF